MQFDRQEKKMEQGKGAGGAGKFKLFSIFALCSSIMAKNK